MLKSLGQIIKGIKPQCRSLGMEITDDAVKIIEVIHRNNNKFIVQSLGKESLPEQAVQDGRIIQPAALIQAIQKLIAMLNIKARQVHLALPSQLVMVRFLKMPDIPLKDLRKVVDFEVKHNIHLPYDDPVYDFIKLNGTQEKVRKLKKVYDKQEKRVPSELAWNEAASSLEAAGTGKQGGASSLFQKDKDDVIGNDPSLQCDVMLAAAPKELIDSYTEVLQASGLKPRSIEIRALSLYRLIEKTELVQADDTFITVDINHSASDLSIFRQNELKITRNVPLHMKSKPSNGTSNLDSMFSEFAEQEDELRNGCNELSHELERLMNFYLYTLNNRNQVFDSVLLSGEMDRLQEIGEFLKERLSLPVRIVNSNNLEISNIELRKLVPSMAVPIGLALRGSKD